MTNCDYTKHQGPKTEKDISICLGTLRGITAESWIKLCGIEGHSLGIETSQQKSKEELRELRLMYYSKAIE